MDQFRRTVIGAAVALAGIAICTAVMVPFRSSLSTAATALVLVMPVVAGVAVGGFLAGVLAAGAGFLAYDAAFIPPYGTLTVGAGQNWIALVVYLVVVLLVSRLVAYLQAARREARRREDDARALYDLTERLIADHPLPELLAQVLHTVDQAFEPRWAAVVMPQEGRLEVVATAGEPLSQSERSELTADTHRPRTLAVSSMATSGRVSVALCVQDRPIGILALSDVALDAERRELLRVYANQAAQAMERSQLRDLALRARVLEESERWRRALLGAVSHDLRSPLATIKAAVSTVREAQGQLLDADRDELLGLIEAQTDDLARLVTNLLDYTRIQSGALELHQDPTAVEDIVMAAVNTVGQNLAKTAVVTDIPPQLPPVDVDDLLMVQVVANLLENAARHAPVGSPIEVRVSRQGDTVALAVRDRGPGVAPKDRPHIFEMWTTSDGGGRAGLGLGIAKAFVEAHGQHLELQEVPGGGACFVVSMAVANLLEAPAAM